MFKSLSRPISWALSILRQFSIAQAAFFVLQFLFIVYLSFFTPLLFRYFFTANFVEHEEPIEFIFRTCEFELHGICSYPEAIVPIGPDNIELSPNYHYTFALDLVLFDTQQNRNLGVIIANIQPKNAQLNSLGNFHKGVPIFQLYAGKSLVFSALVQARNLAFLPFFLCGFFAPSEYNTISVKFSNKYLEQAENRTRFVVIQLQNKFVQLSSAVLRIEAHLGLLRYAISDFPILTYFVLFGSCSAFYFSVFMLYWARRGYMLIESIDVSSNLQAITLPLENSNGLKPLKKKEICRKSEDSSDSGDEFIDAFSNVFFSEFPDSANPKITANNEHSKLLKPSWNQDEVPDCPKLLTVPGWNFDTKIDSKKLF